jgi:hypothetical protein
VSEWQSSNSESDTALKSVLVAFSKMKERAGAQSKKGEAVVRARRVVDVIVTNSPNVLFIERQRLPPI